MLSHMAEFPFLVERLNSIPLCVLVYTIVRSGHATFWKSHSFPLITAYYFTSGKWSITLTYFPSEGHTCCLYPLPKIIVQRSSLGVPWYFIVPGVKSPNHRVYTYLVSLNPATLQSKMITSGFPECSYFPIFLLAGDVFNAWILPTWIVSNAISWLCYLTFLWL